ncbi:MAG: DUF4358 domain-containing protein [Clostridiales bacterium]|nr:DUF4358 domain-containing protein [Clostridiales bacterium]
MNKISLLVVFAIITTMLFSCGDDKKPSAEPASREILNALLQIFDENDYSNTATYHSDAAEGTNEYIDEGYMSFVFLGEYDVDIAALPLISEYSIVIPSGLFPFEIDVMKAKSAAAANEVKALLERRMEQKKKTRGELENYESEHLPILDSCEIYTNGAYVILIATPDNKQVKDKLKELFNAETPQNDEQSDALDSTHVNEGIIDAVSHINDNLTGGEENSVGSSRSENPSELPVMTVNSYSANNFVVLGGSCVEGAKIHVRGGVKDMTFGTDHESWLCEVEIPVGGVTNLYITQEEIGKDESEPITIILQSRTDVDFSSQGVCQVAIGDNMQGHFYGQIADWCGTNLLTERQIEGVTGRIKDKVDYLDSLDCELIYLIVPNPMTIYPETVPERFVRSTAETTRTEQFEKAAQAAGATVIDLYDVLMEHRDDEYKIFHKVDSHWTDYGAYWGQWELMTYISETWEDAKPVEQGIDVEFYNKTVDGGDMMVHMGIQNSLLKEYTTFVQWKTATVWSPNVYVNGRNQLDFDPINKTVTITNRISDGDLPTAMVIRDSFSTNIYGYLNNSFSEVYWQSMWNYKFDKNYIENTKPDYYIILVTERNIDNLLG